MVAARNKWRRPSSASSFKIDVGACAPNWVESSRWQRCWFASCCCLSCLWCVYVTTCKHCHKLKLTMASERIKESSAGLVGQQRERERGEGSNGESGTRTRSDSGGACGGSESKAGRGATTGTGTGIGHSKSRKTTTMMMMMSRQDARRAQQWSQWSARSVGNWQDAFAFICRPTQWLARLHTLTHTQKRACRSLCFVVRVLMLQNNLYHTDEPIGLHWIAVDCSGSDPMPAPDALNRSRSGALLLSRCVIRCVVECARALNRRRRRQQLEAASAAPLWAASTQLASDG